MPIAVIRTGAARRWSNAIRLIGPHTDTAATASPWLADRCCDTTESGDRLLTVLGEILRTSLRRIDFVARYGGDEFALLLPHTDSGRALRVASRLLRVVSEHEFNLPEELLPVRLSAGISVVPENAADADTLIALAEYALHEARELGPGSIIRIGDPKPTEAK